MTRIKTSPISPTNKASNGEARLPSTMPEGHATRELSPSSSTRLVLDFGPVDVPPTDMATALAIGDELDELEAACNKFNAQAPSNEPWQVVDVDSVAEALETVSLGHATPEASASSNASSTVDSEQAADVKKEASNEASEDHSPSGLPDVKAEDKKLKAGEVVDNKSTNNKPADTTPIKANPTDIKSIDGSPPYHTPPTGPDVFRLASKFCRCCFQPATYRITKPDNENVNAGRPYWVCTNKLCYATMKSKYEDGWVSWADGKGVSDENPVCYCDVPSRQDKIGKDEGKKGLGFWTCTEGTCDYYSEDADGLEYGDVSREYLAFEPWLL